LLFQLGPNWQLNRSTASKWGGKVGSTDEANLVLLLARSGRTFPNENEVERALPVQAEEETNLHIHGDSSGQRSLVLAVLLHLEGEGILPHVILLRMKDGLHPRRTLGIIPDRRRRSVDETILDLLQMSINEENDMRRLREHMCPVLRDLGLQVQVATGTNKRNGAIKSHDTTRRRTKVGRRTSTPSPISVVVMSGSQNIEIDHLLQVGGEHRLGKFRLLDFH
jgi:hypothetical protein